MEEKIKEIFNEMAKKYAEATDELEKYKNAILPKFKVGSRLYVADKTKERVTEIIVDEIIIKSKGTYYREYESETSFVQFPELVCFDDKALATKYLEIH